MAASTRVRREFPEGLHDGLEYRPEKIPGTGLADVMADRDVHFRRRISPASGDALNRPLETASE